MLQLDDPQVRLLLLQHLATRLYAGSPADAHAAGLLPEQVAKLRELSAVDLGSLAATRQLGIGVQVDGNALDANLRAAVLSREARWMEAYFIRHGASWQMMRSLFTVGRRVTHERRHESGARRRPGRVRLPGMDERERIYRAWCGIDESILRQRYYRLHLRYPQWSIEALEMVVRQFEADR